MEPCPFCKSPVAEDLVRFGGSCPHCFIEIPGEEAPTNPGVQAEPTAATEASSSRGASAGVLAALILLLGLGGGFMVWMNNSAEGELAYDDEEPEFFIVPSSELPSNEQLPEVPAVGDQAVAQTNPGTQAATAAVTAPTYVAPAQNTQVASAQPTQRDDARPEPVRSNLSPTLGPDEDPQVIPTFGVTALSDPNMIRTMVQEVIGRYKGQMKHCYEQRLKTNESLRGTWYLSFTIQTSGGVAGVSAVGKGVQDPELESCMVRNATKWRFQPVAESQYIQAYPFRFGS